MWEVLRARPSPAWPSEGRGTRRRDTGSGGGSGRVRSGRGSMSEAKIRGTREPAMRRRREASSTRNSRRRSLSAERGYTDRPQATRGCRSDRSSDLDPSSIHLRPRTTILSRSPPARTTSTATGQVRLTTRRSISAGLVTEFLLLRDLLTQVAPVVDSLQRRYPDARSFGGVLEDHLNEVIASLGLRWRRSRLVQLAQSDCCDDG